MKLEIAVFVSNLTFVPFNYPACALKPEFGTVQPLTPTNAQGMYQQTDNLCEVCTTRSKGASKTVLYELPFENLPCRVERNNLKRTHVQTKNPRKSTNPITHQNPSKLPCFQTKRGRSTLFASKTLCHVSEETKLPNFRFFSDAKHFCASIRSCSEVAGISPSSWQLHIQEIKRGWLWVTCNPHLHRHHQHHHHQCHGPRLQRLGIWLLQVVRHRFT